MFPPICFGGCLPGRVGQFSQPGDFGTHGGLVTDADARVLDAQRRPIPGLYATGNCTAALLPTYPGPGATLGPAMTFAWQAARHLTAWKG